MNYTRGPWSIQLRPTSALFGQSTWLSLDENSGPLFIVDMHDKVIAAVVHREGRAQGFSETASNARLIRHSPELYEKSRALVNALRERWGGYPAPDCQDQLEALEIVLDALSGVVSFGK